MIKEISPTSIQKMRTQCNGNELFIKRDDLIPFSFGGNKVRKAIHFLKEIEEQECNYIVTYGSDSSNHCRIIANMAASRGINCTIITPDDTNKITYNSRMISYFGAEIINCDLTYVKETIENTLRKLKDDGHKPYFIHGGGHGNVGTKAYVEAYEEVFSFELENNIKFDYIFHTSGTGTTQAGLICGSLLNGNRSKIVGISNARKNPYGSKVVLESVNSYLKLLGEKAVGLEAVNFIDEYVLGGYGSYNYEVMAVIEEVLFTDGIPLDPIYTGKGFFGMKKYIEKNQITQKNVLFIHTGGTPLFFDNLEVEKNDWTTEHLDT